MKRFWIGLVLGLTMAQSAAWAKEQGFSTATDPGVVTLKDVRLTLPDSWGTVAFMGRDRLRYELWNYFTSATDNDYEFLGNQLRLGTKWVHELFNFNFTWQYVQHSNLPTATSAGAGAGSLYFSNSRDRNSSSQFIKALNIEVKQTRKLLKPFIGDQKWLRGVTEQVGRFNYSSGNDFRSADKKLEAVKASRVGDRLIGGFEWSNYGRAFDGAKIAREDDFSYVSFAAFSPTQGGFEENAQRRIQDIDVLALEADVKKDRLLPGAEEQLFYYYYDDHRNIAAASTRLDNTGRSLAAGGQADVEIHTIGGHVVADYNVGPGVLDLLGWGAYQTGKWYDLDHSAWAFAAEGGYQLLEAPWKPWLRVGYDVGSGDDAAVDGDHGTFFQMLPTARIYSQSLIYNMQNTHDLFYSLTVKPMEQITVKTEGHMMWLDEKADRWYLGSGAMHDNVLDDFAARASNGSSDLGKLADVQVTYAINPDASVTLYYGHFFGGDVVKKFFTTQRNSDMVYAEFTISF